MKRAILKKRIYLAILFFVFVLNATGLSAKQTPKATNGMNNGDVLILESDKKYNARKKEQLKKLKNQKEKNKTVHSKAKQGTKVKNDTNKVQQKTVAPSGDVLILQSEEKYKGAKTKKGKAPKSNLTKTKVVNGKEKKSVSVKTKTSGNKGGKTNVTKNKTAVSQKKTKKAKVGLAKNKNEEELMDNSMFSLVPYMSFPLGYVRTRHKYGGGMRFGYHKTVAFLDKKTRLRVGVNAAFFVYSSEDYKIQFFPIYPELVFTFGRKALVQPYLSVGGGLAFVWAENPNDKGLGNDGLLTFSLGSVFYLKKVRLVSFITEIQYLMLFEKGNQGMFLNVGLGIVFNFK